MIGPLFMHFAVNAGKFRMSRNYISYKVYEGSYPMNGVEVMSKHPI